MRRQLALTTTAAVTTTNRLRVIPSRTAPAGVCARMLPTLMADIATPIRAGFQWSADAR